MTCKKCGGKTEHGVLMQTIILDSATEGSDEGKFTGVMEIEFCKVCRLGVVIMAESGESQ